MKRPIEKILLILNSLIGLIFIGSVVISKIPLFKLNILDKYLNYSFGKGGILITAFVLAGVYLILSILLIVNRLRFTNNSIYVYGESSIGVTSHNIKKIAKSVCKEIEGIKSVNIDIQLGEFGNCLLVNAKLYDGYDFQALVGKLRPKLEEAITMNLGIKFPSYKFADGNVLFEFGAPYAGVGIDLDVEKPSNNEVVMPESPKTMEPVKKSEEDIEDTFVAPVEPFDVETDEIQKDNVFPDVDFEPQEPDVFTEEHYEPEETLAPDQYSIPYTMANKGMMPSSFEKKEERRTEYSDPFGSVNTISSGKAYNQFQAPKTSATQSNVQKPLQAAYDNINNEIQKQSMMQQQKIMQNAERMKEPSRSEQQAQFGQGVRQPLRPTPSAVQGQKPMGNPVPSSQPVQNPVPPQRPRPQEAQSKSSMAYQGQRPYPQRPTSMSVRPTPHSANTAISQNSSIPASSQININQNNAQRRPQAPQRSTQTKLSKEDVYARINAILNKYSKSDDDNNK